MNILNIFVFIFIVKFNIRHVLEATHVLELPLLTALVNNYDKKTLNIPQKSPDCNFILVFEHGPTI